MEIKAIIELALGALVGKVEPFYLTGGTALANFHFQHRLSVDLDFFAPAIDEEAVARIITALNSEFVVTAELVKRVDRTGRAMLRIFVLDLSEHQLKVDFVQDPASLSRPVQVINGVPVMALRDIYIHKLLAISGVVPRLDEIGRIMPTGRQEAKDLYDLYCLSTLHRPLADFIAEAMPEANIRAIVRWYRTFDRMDIITALLELIDYSGQGVLSVDTRAVLGHFEKQIEALIRREIG
ncbi:MAG: nucleotidyl transferase AbiEii/AbiGii toxin family protein [Lentisphaerota bacterium]